MQGLRLSFQHEYMSDNYIAFIANRLKQLESYFISSSFRNAASNGYFDSVIGEPWNWDSFYADFGDAIEGNPTGLADYLITFLNDQTLRNSISNPDRCR